ncbi:MAG: superoxide dismutase [Bacteroidia bacterium]|nr:superoxide dismutase [Bacteroidia bacterium]
MDKRTFLKISALTTAGLVVSPLTACKNEGEEKKADTGAAKAFELPALAYAFNALEPNIDARTMEIHHDKHHAGYVRKLNAAVEGSKYAGMELGAIMAGITDSDADTAVRNNGGGHYNHSLFWRTIGPKGGNPEGKLADAINSAFGSFEDFKSKFSSEAKGVFGSGWAWLCAGADQKLFITSTPNQDNPLMTNIAEQAGSPILGIDVWEHAYYLNYKNMRGDYINNFFNIINWEEVAANYDKIG